MDEVQEIKNKIIANLAFLDEQITEEEIQKASKEELLKYLDLTNQIKARLEQL